MFENQLKNSINGYIQEICSDDRKVWRFFFSRQYVKNVLTVFVAKVEGEGKKIPIYQMH